VTATTGHVEWGFAADEHDMWCAKWVGTEARMVCGRRKGWMPPVGLPFSPPNVCPDCAAVLAGRAVPVVADDQAEGTCPVCVGRAPLDEQGLVAAHGQWSFAGGTPVVTRRPCAGAGELPEEDE
jgi:hypothetical protein